MVLNKEHLPSHSSWSFFEHKYLQGVKMTFTESSMPGMKTHLKTYLVLHVAMSYSREKSFVFMLLKGVARTITWIMKSCCNCGRVTANTNPTLLPLVSSELTKYYPWKCGQPSGPFCPWLDCACQEERQLLPAVVWEALWETIWDCWICFLLVIPSCMTI